MDQFDSWNDTDIAIHIVPDCPLHMEKQKVTQYERRRFAEIILN
jgi:hypothetical protein